MGAAIWCEPKKGQPIKGNLFLFRKMRKKKKPKKKLKALFQFGSNAFKIFLTIFKKCCIIKLLIINKKQI